MFCDRVLAINLGLVGGTGTPGVVQGVRGVIVAYLGTVEDVSSLRREVTP
jgi:branched-chain amino acid transport system ATP-binding protein